MLLRLGWSARLIGAIGLSGGHALDSVIASLPLLWNGMLALSYDAAGVFLIAVSFPALRLGRQYSARIVTTFDELDDTRYLLYLRSFAYDRALAAAAPTSPRWWMNSPYEILLGIGLTVEDVVVRQFAAAGRVVAVGRPGERLPLIGAQRGYLPAEDWQGAVTELLRGAHAVLMMASLGRGTIWEFTEAVRTVPPTRLVLLIAGDAEEYAHFRSAVTQEDTRRAAGRPDWPAPPRLPDLPACTPPTTGVHWKFPLHTIITFDTAWHPTVTGFHPVLPRLRWIWTARRRVRRELAPIVDPLIRLPPRPCAADHE